MAFGTNTLTVIVSVFGTTELKVLVPIIVVNSYVKAIVKTASRKPPDKLCQGIAIITADPEFVSVAVSSWPCHGKSTAIIKSKVDIYGKAQITATIFALGTSIEIEFDVADCDAIEFDIIKLKPLVDLFAWIRKVGHIRSQNQRIILSHDVCNPLSSDGLKNWSTITSQVLRPAAYLVTPSCAKYSVMSFSTPDYPSFTEDSWPLHGKSTDVNFGLSIVLSSTKPRVNAIPDMKSSSIALKTLTNQNNGELDIYI